MILDTGLEYNAGIAIVGSPNVIPYVKSKQFLADTANI